MRPQEETAITAITATEAPAVRTGVPRRHIVFAPALMAAGALAAPAAWAQAFPDRPIRLIVNSAPGGALDVSARHLADRLTLKLGKPVICENKPGAGGVLGAASVAKSPADGYTLLMVSAGYSMLPALQPSLPFTHADFAPVAVAVSVPFVFVTSPTAPYKTLREFITYAKARPGQMSFASGGNATAGHLLGTWFKAEAGLDLQHIPFKGEGPAVQSMLGDQIQLMPATISISLPLVKAGKLRALAISSATRSMLLPDVPTIVEQGVAVQSVTWFGVLAPAGVPKDVLARLNEAINQVLQEPDLREKYNAIGMEVGGGSQAEFQSLITREAAQWARLIKENGIKPE